MTHIAEQPQSQPPQTTHVFVDRPCLKCGYNLRGQSAVWNRRALNWQVTCPECGSAQVVLIGTPERRGIQHPLFALAVAAIGGWVAWQLLWWLSTSVSAMMSAPPESAVTVAMARRLAAASSISALDTDWVTLASYLLVHAIPGILAALGVGILIALAPYATVRQRNLLLLILVSLACLYGAFLNLAGLMIDSSSPQARAQLLQMMNAGLLANTSQIYDIKWKLVSGLSALLITLIAGRIGLAVGRPFGRMVATMYVKPIE